MMREETSVKRWNEAMDDHGERLLAMIGGGPPMDRPCGLCGAIVRDVPGPCVCDECAEKLRTEELEERLRPALESIPKRWRWANFDDTDLLASRCGAAAGRAARIAIKHMLERGDRPFAVLAGPSRTGKTSLACAMLRYAIRAGHRFSPGCRFVFAPDISTAYRESQRGVVPDVIEMCRSSTVLVIDDLGCDTVYTDVLRQIMQARENAQRLTIVTTFLSEGDVRSTYGDGLAARLFEDGWRIDMGNRTARRERR